MRSCCDCARSSAAQISSAAAPRYRPTGLRSPSPGPPAYGAGMPHVKEGSDMATSTEELRFRATGQDAGAGRMFDKLGDKADDAKDEVKGFDRQLGKLDEQLDLTKLHLAVLLDEFDRTGDKTLFKDIRKDRSTISFLEKLRKEMRGVGDDAEEVAPVIRRNLLGSLRDALSSLPSELKGSLIIGAAGTGAVMAPLLGAAIGGAVLGGVGTGGIIGGIALAAQDDRVAAAGKELGQHLLGQLQSNGQSFVAPLLVAIGEVDDATTGLLADVGDEFRGLSKLVVPLSQGLGGLIRNLGPGLSDALEASEPIIRAVSEELPELGDSISYMLQAISSQSDGATLGWISLLNIVEEGVEGFGNIVGALSATYEWLVRTTHAVAEGEAGFLGIAAAIAPFGLATGWVDDQTQSLIEDLDKAKASNDTLVGGFDDLANSTDRARRAMVDFSQSVEDQFDPTANLIHRLQDVKDRQREYSEAVREHGRNSREAKEANLALAQAILAASSASAAAAGTFDGKLTPALRATLKAGGLTDAQLADIEKQALAAHRALDKYADVYKARAILEFSEYRAGERNPSGRASGGPVEAGRTYLVGENGPELVTPTASGYVHTAQQTQAMLSSGTGDVGAGSGSVQVAVTVSLDPSLIGHSRDLAASLVQMLRYETRTTAGGDVQVMFGQAR
ncbi:hypothetical protein ACFOZ4_28565 [Hamadaea flava]|uniref:Tail tape measure protein n=1 Tax=Hamadaea flava TaxID=1742688 RepID=A0ABV8LU40_9ACTN